MANPSPPNDFERFKWDMLGDAVFEDWQGVWEPLFWLRGGGALAGQTEADRQRWAERALRELFAEGLIYFFRVPRGVSLDDAGEDERLRLTDDEVDATLADDWWRGREGFPDSHPNVWWGPTSKGEAAAKDPPAQIRAQWRLDA